MNPTALPQVLGHCAHCTLELYNAGPVHTYQDGRISHVACHVDHQRR